MMLGFWNRFARRSRCIAIVGNGFDMAHGLKTGYNDFVNAQNKDTFSEYKVFLEKYCGNANGWSSFEERINELTYNCYGHSFDDSQNYDDVLQDVKRINALFENLHSYLSDYLIGAPTKGKIAKKFSVSWAMRGNIPAISFNYTNTAELYTKSVLYVHGSLKEKEIVLGYDFREEPCLMTADMMCWSKYLCRERLAFSRYLKEQQRISLNETTYRECMQDVSRMQHLKNSGRGFEEEDWATFNHPDIIKSFYAGDPCAYSDAFTSVALSTIKEIVVLGHGLTADEHYLKDILSKCPKLKKVVIFTYSGENESSLNVKKAFFQPYCREVVTRKY